MGYARVVQYADVVEYYEYDKEITPRRPPPRKSLLERNRAKARRLLGVPKSKFSVKRAKTQFFRICAEALYTRGRPLFLTLTFAQEFVSITSGYQAINELTKHIKSKMGETIAYIAVPEWQKKGKLHFHLLVWGLSQKNYQNERSTRNLQRLYGKGFLDVRLAYDNSPKLASYFAKYFTKAYTDTRLGARKAYTTSRSIIKPRQVGSNTLTSYTDIILPQKLAITETVSYDTQYLGRCRLTKYKI